jgi:hypothetical protein
MLGIKGTIRGADMHPPGAGAYLPPWKDIAVRIEHCPYCAAVRAVASWDNEETTISLAWALWHLWGGGKK